MSATEFQFGTAKVNRASGGKCCNKPEGCTITDPDVCVHLGSTVKRALLFGDTSVRCQAKGLDPATGEPTQCGLRNGHAPPCDPRPA